MPRPSAAAVIVALAAALPAQAQDERRGRQLYETYCLPCHYEHVHERARSRSTVHSLEDMKKETALRAGLTALRFTREDLADVVSCLDQPHYHFGR